MGSIEQTANLYRSLRFNAIGKGLQQLLSEAEANDLSYLQLPSSSKPQYYPCYSKRAFSSASGVSE